VDVQVRRTGPRARGGGLDGGLPEPRPRRGGAAARGRGRGRYRHRRAGSVLRAGGSGAGGPVHVTAPVRLLIHGASGRMGRALLRLAADDPGVQAVAAVARSIDQRVVDGVAWFAAGEMRGAPDFDVAVD